MKLALFDDYRIGVVSDGKVVDVSAALPERDTSWPWAFVPRLIESFPDLRPRLAELAFTGPAIALGEVILRAPVPNPSKVIAAVANYSRHHGEVGGGAGSIPGEIFLKAPSSVVGPGTTVVLPNAPGRVIHHESELALVIGRRAKDLDPLEAITHVFGYTCLIDMSARGNGDRSRRKSYDGFTPLGPWIVTADEIPDAQNLDITLRVDDSIRQSGNTRHMTYGLSELVAYASRVMTLHPGDVIATGTPEGVGAVVGGEQLHLEIEGIGGLTVSIAAPPAEAPVQDLLPPLRNL